MSNSFFFTNPNSLFKSSFLKKSRKPIYYFVYQTIPKSSIPPPYILEPIYPGISGAFFYLRS